MTLIIIATLVVMVLISLFNGLIASIEPKAVYTTVEIINYTGETHYCRECMIRHGHSCPNSHYSN